MKANQREGVSELVGQLVVFLSARPEDLERFFAISGIGPDELRARLADTGFQTGVLDYVASNEPLLLAFCEESGNNPAMVARVAATNGRRQGFSDGWN